MVLVVVHRVILPRLIVIIDMPDKHPVIRQLGIPFVQLAIFEDIPFVLAERNAECEVARSKRRNGHNVVRHVQRIIVQPAHKIPFERAVVRGRNTAIVVHARRHHVPGVRTGSLVIRIFEIGIAIIAIHAIMVLESHRMAELMDEGREQVIFLLDDKVAIELLALAGIHPAVTPAVSIIPQFVLEPAQMLIPGLDLSPGKKDAEGIHVAVIVGVIECCVEIGVLAQQSLYTLLDQRVLVADVTGKGIVHLYKVQVVSRHELARRLVYKIIPHGTRVVVLRIVFLVQEPVYLGRIEIPRIVVLDEQDGKPVGTVCMGVRRRKPEYKRGVIRYSFRSR